MAEFVPMCTPEGAFEKKQCISSTKECWCVNPNGVEIPGTRLKHPVVPDCDFGKYDPGTSCSLMSKDQLFKALVA